jgi:hypothetical protein
MYTLMVKAVDHKSGFKPKITELTFVFYGYRMGQVFPGRVPIVGKACRPLPVQIAIQAATKRHVDQLKATTDSKERNILLYSQLNEVQFQAVTGIINPQGRAIIYFSIDARIDITASAE